MNLKRINILVTAAITALLAAVSPLCSAALDGGTVRVNTVLNVRAAPSTSAEIEDRLECGRTVTLYDEVGDWWRIGYRGGDNGYVHSAYIERLNLPVRYVKTRGSNLNVRRAPSVAAAIIGKVADRSALPILGVEGDFAKVLFEGERVGYVSRDYLVVAAPDASAANEILLAVPAYKQGDSRWASKRLPGSGERLSTHGCAVTALAMTESFRTGDTVTPTDILSSMKFTSSGAIYWPEFYFKESGTYESVYRRLLEGHPVIFHAVKSSGGSHFVVVYGFLGGALEPENFLIHDPGAGTRHTLADFLAVYPTAVKSLAY